MWGREVVLTRAGVVSAVGTAVAVLAVLGVGVTDAQRDKAVDVLVVALPVALPLLGALWSRLHVTPVWDPRDDQGQPLVPAETVSPRQDDFASGHDVPDTDDDEPVTAAVRPDEVDDDLDEVDEIDEVEQPVQPASGPDGTLASLGLPTQPTQPGPG